MQDSNSAHCVWRCFSHENCEMILKAVKATDVRDGAIYVCGEHGEVVEISDNSDEDCGTVERKVVMKAGAWDGKGIGDEFRADVFKYYDAGHGPGAIWTRRTADYEKDPAKKSRIPSIKKLASHVQALRNRPIEQIRTNGDLAAWIHDKNCPVPITDATEVRAP